CSAASDCGESPAMSTGFSRAVTCSISSAPAALIGVVAMTAAAAGMIGVCGTAASIAPACVVPGNAGGAGVTVIAAAGAEPSTSTPDAPWPGGGMSIGMGTLAATEGFGPGGATAPTP